MVAPGEFARSRRTGGAPKGQRAAPAGCCISQGRHPPRDRYRGSVTTDPLAPLLQLADVADMAARVRERVDAVLRHRGLRRHGGQVAAEAGLRTAVASAALEGHAYDLEAVRAGTVIDPVVQGALRVAGALPGLADLWPKAPRQVLAKMHVLAASGVAGAAELGRPVTDPAMARRLDAIVALVAGGTAAPPVVLAAVVCGELLALQPFSGPNGVVARAAGRLTLISTGFDPRGLIAVDLGHLEREPEYVGSAGAFATGTPDGVRSWLRHYGAAVEVGAEQVAVIADDVLAGG